MEGCDGTYGGEPGDLTIRRYRRFASGGAGLLWFEATAVTGDARANPRQLFLNWENFSGFQRLLETARNEAVKRFGEDTKPFTILQLTHSGRYSRPVSEPRPIIEVYNPYLPMPDASTCRIITDSELESLEDIYVEAALMAGELGFDAVDIKSCHRYLISGLLGAHLREGPYGGDFEGRTRFLLNIVDKINQASKGTVSVAVRLNVYDAIPYPYGWGVDEKDHRRPDLFEPVRLVRLLSKHGVRLVNITAGNPYYNPHVNRPYDTGPYVPVEHPLEGVARMITFARDVKRAVPKVTVVASGFSWLREFGAAVAAGCMREGWFDIAGFGRQAFAYPDFAADILDGGGMKRKRCCIACGKCSEIMRRGGTTGCVIRDSGLYAPIYQELSEGKPSLVSHHVAEHV